MSDSRYEIPDDLSAEDERAIIAALERYLTERDAGPSPWAMTGRMEACREGTLQARRYLRGAWGAAARGNFARRGTEPILGRGDAA